MWQAEDALKCGGCGNPLDESTDPEHRTAWITEPVVCWACASRERKSTADHRDGAHPAPGSLYQTRNRAWD